MLKHVLAIRRIKGLLIGEGYCRFRGARLDERASLTGLALFDFIAASGLSCILGFRDMLCSVILFSYYF